MQWNSVWLSDTAACLSVDTIRQALLVTACLL